MKILNFEDDVFKQTDIEKAVAAAGKHEIVCVRNVEDGLEQIRSALRRGEPFDLVITDMHFPLTPGGEESFSAGKTVMEELRRENIGIPVIVCSSMNLQLTEAYGCVWYSHLSDWDMELADMVRKLSRRF